MANHFIAWPVELPELPTRLGEIPESVRRFAPTDLHITLAFLGPVGEEAARAGFDALDVSRLTRVEVTFGDVILMGHPKRGTALSATIVQGHAKLATQIGEQRRAVLDASGGRPEKYDPNPHMTVARIGRRAPAPARSAALRWASALDLAGLRASIDRVALYTWSVDRPRTQFRIDRELTLTS